MDRLRKWKSMRRRSFLACIALAAAVAVGVLLFTRWRPSHGSSSAPAEALRELDDARSLPPPALEHAESAMEGRASIAADAELAPNAPAPGLLLMRGRVVDEERRPVAGARVEISFPGIRVPSVESASDGSFERIVAAGPESMRARFSVRARDGAGRAGHRQAWIPASSTEGSPLVDAGTLVLLPAHALRARVVDEGEPVSNARVIVELGHERVSPVEAQANAAGELTLEALPAGPVHLTASTPGRRGHVRAFVPEERQVVIELEQLASVAIQVVDAATGAGIAGAKFEVLERFEIPAALPGDLNPFRFGEVGSARPLEGGRGLTDAKGCATVAGFAAGLEYELELRAPGYEPIPPNATNTLRLGADSPSLRIEMKPLALRTVCWPIAAGELPAPAHGVESRLRWTPGFTWQELPFELDPPALGRMEKSMLVVHGIVGCSSLHAEAPDGALAWLWVDESAAIGREASFRRPRHIDVLVRDATGAPAARAMVVARSKDVPSLGRAVTDANGRARIEGLFGGLASVYAIHWELGYAESDSVDLDLGDQRIELTLSAPIRGRVRVTIGGDPRLPARFEVRGYRVIEEIPERGELVLQLYGAERDRFVRLFIDAVGFMPAAVDFELPRDGSEVTAEVELEPAAALIAHVTRHANDRSPIVELQRYDGDAGAWNEESAIFDSPWLSWPNGPDGTFVFRHIRPGRWRVVAVRSHIASSPVEVTSGDREVHVALDLR